MQCMCKCNVGMCNCNVGVCMSRAYFWIDLPCIFLIVVICSGPDHKMCAYGCWVPAWARDIISWIFCSTSSALGGVALSSFTFLALGIASLVFEFALWQWARVCLACASSIRRVSAGCTSLTRWRSCSRPTVGVNRIGGATAAELHDMWST